MQRGWAGGRIPEQLRVVVGMDVDEPGGHDETVGLNRATTRVVDGAEAHDAAVTDADVGAEAGRSRPVDDRSSTNK